MNAGDYPSEKSTKIKFDPRKSAGSREKQLVDEIVYPLLPHLADCCRAPPLGGWMCRLTWPNAPDVEFTTDYR